MLASVESHPLLVLECQDLLSTIVTRDFANRRRSEVEASWVVVGIRDAINLLCSLILSLALPFLKNAYCCTAIHHKRRFFSLLL